MRTRAVARGLEVFVLLYPAHMRLADTPPHCASVSLAKSVHAHTRCPTRFPFRFCSGSARGRQVRARSECNPVVHSLPVTLSNHTNPEVQPYNDHVRTAIPGLNRWRRQDGHSFLQGRDRNPNPRKERRRVGHPTGRTHRSWSPQSYGVWFWVQ